LKFAAVNVAMFTGRSNVTEIGALRPTFTAFRDGCVDDTANWADAWPETISMAVRGRATTDRVRTAAHTEAANERKVGKRMSEDLQRIELHDTSFLRRGK
jgi:hypothetical protein